MNNSPHTEEKQYEGLSVWTGPNLCTLHFCARFKVSFFASFCHASQAAGRSVAFAASPIKNRFAPQILVFYPRFAPSFLAAACSALLLFLFKEKRKALTSDTQIPDYTGTPRPRPARPDPPAAGRHPFSANSASRAIYPPYLIRISTASSISSRRSTSISSTLFSRAGSTGRSSVRSTFGRFRRSARRTEAVSGALPTLSRTSFTAGADFTR